MLRRLRRLESGNGALLLMKVVFVCTCLMVFDSCINQQEKEITYQQVYTEIDNVTGTPGIVDQIKPPRKTPFVLPEGRPLTAPIEIPRRMKDQKNYPLPTFKSLSNPKEVIAHKDSLHFEKSTLKDIQTTPAKTPEQLTVKSIVPENDLTKFIFEEFNTLSPANITPQKDGSIWFSSYWGGAYRFNGKHLFRFSDETGLSSTNVFDVVEDLDKEIWIATLKGLSRYNGLEIMNYGKKDNIEQIKNIIKGKKNNIWFIGDRTLQRIDKSTHELTTLNISKIFGSTVQGIEMDEEGNIWLGIKDKGFAILPFQQNEEEFKFKLYTIDAGLPFEGQHEPLHNYSFYEASNGNMWMATNFGCFEFTKFMRKNWDAIEYRFYGKEQGLEYNKINAIIENADGQILMSHRKGLYAILMSDDSTSLHIHPTHSNEVKALFKDSNNDVWIGYAYDGITKQKSSVFKVLYDEFNTQTNVQNFAEDRWGNLWIGTYGYGLLCLRKGKNENPTTLVSYGKEQGLPSFYNDGLQIDKNGNLWVSYRNAGISILELSNEGRTVLHRKIGKDQGVTAFFISKVFKDQKDDMWFIANPFTEQYDAGIYQYNGTDLFFYTDTSGLIDEKSKYIAQDIKGNFWFCSTENGLIKFNPSLNDKGTGEWTYFNKSHGLLADELNRISIDQLGSIWVPSGKGLSQLIPSEDHTSYTIRNYNQSNASKVLEDFDQNLWFVGTDLGKTNRQSLNRNLEDGPFEIYTYTDGYGGYNDDAVLQTSDSIIWLGSGSGVRYFNPKELIQEKKQPQVALLDVLLYNEKISWTKDTTIQLRNGVKIKDAKFDALQRWNSQPEYLSLAYKNNNIGFCYSAIEITYPQKVKYKYILEGLQEYWSLPNEETKVNYAGLLPGSYTFKVKAKVGRGEWSNPLEYTFKIRPPWYRTWWAYFIYGCIILSGLIYFIRSKVSVAIQKLKVIEAMRTKISSDLHDDVGTILAGVAMQAEILALNENNEDTEELKELSTFTRTAMEKMRDIVWAMDSRKDKYENLIEKMMHFANAHLKDSQFTCHFEINEIEREAKLNPEVRQNLYLVFKEAITNIRKHSMEIK